MSISQDWITNELEDTELEALHRSPSVEYSFYNAVRAGDMEAVNKNCEEDSFPVSYTHLDVYKRQR